MSTEQDTGKNRSKTLSVIVLGVVIVLAGGYWFLSWLYSDRESATSSVNLNGISRTSSTVTAETPRYRELLQASNDKGAEEASRTNGSFIASLPAGLEPSGEEDTKASPPAPRPRPPRTTDVARPEASAAAEQQASEKRKEAMQKLLTRISNAQNVNGAPVLAHLRSETPDPGMAASGKNDTLAGLSSGAVIPAQQFVPALTRVAGFVETAVDSDNTTSQVIAVIPTGELAGARLHSASVKMVGKGVEINFRKMSWRGMTLNVNAYAQQEDTLASSVASDVNHRWMTHIVLPAALGGLGDLGGLYKDANTQILQTNVSTVTGKVGKPDGETVGGVILGGTAQKGAEVISQEMAREPFRQVTVKQNEVVSILFVDAVTSNNLADAKGGVTSTPPPTPRSAAENLTENRLQETIEQRRAEIRRQYGSN